MTEYETMSWPMVARCEDAFASEWADSCGPGGDPAEFWRAASHLGKELAEDTLALRMLSRLVVGEQSHAETRFVALLLESNGVSGLAARLTDFSLDSSAKPWQRRRLTETRDRYLEEGVAAVGPSSSVRLIVKEGRVWLPAGSPDMARFGTWKDALLDLARIGTPNPSPTTVIVEVYDLADTSFVEDLVVLAYLGNLRVAIIDKSGELTVPKRVRDWLGRRGLCVPVFEPQDGGLRLTKLFGRTLHRPAHFGHIYSERNVKRWLEFDWLLESATSRVFDVPRLFELNGLVNAISDAQLPQSDAQIAAEVIAFVEGIEARGLALERLATVFLDRGDFGIAECLLMHVPSESQSSYFQGRVNRAWFGLAKFELVCAQGDGAPTRKQDRARVEESKAVVELLRALEAAESVPTRIDVDNSESFSVASILHASAPHQSGGYANRAHQLLSAVQSTGIHLKAFTRPGFPDESLSTGDDWADPFEGVNYVRLGGDRSRSRGEYQYMLECLDTYRRILRIERPDVVHLRSTYVSALPGIIAARELGIPTVYEVSGMWELVYATYGDARRESMRARTVRLEDAVLRTADRIVTLTQAMADIIDGRVLTKNPIEVLPNAVDVNRFRPVAKDEQLLSELNWSTDVPIVGYAGSVVDYEGIEVLVDALSLLRDDGVDFRFVLIGDGAVMPRVRARIAERGLDEFVLVTGRIPHVEVERYYSIFDICAFPRLSTPATEAVSPLKPFEALASGKAVVVSDVSALAEIIGDNERGIVVPNADAAALSDALRRLMESPELRSRLGSVSRDWVVANHTWEAVGGRFVTALRSSRKAS